MIRRLCAATKLAHTSSLSWPAPGGASNKRESSGGTAAPICACLRARPNEARASNLQSARHGATSEKEDPARQLALRGPRVLRHDHALCHRAAAECCFTSEVRFFPMFAQIQPYH